MPKENGQYSIDDFRIPEVRVQLKENPAGTLWSDTPITSSEDAANVIGNSLLRHVDREYLILVAMSNALKPVAYNIVSIGSINATLAHPREILKPIILANAANMMLMHSHPSGETTPSREDIALTHRISAIGDLIEVPLLDHVIIGCGENAKPYFSFREHDMLRGDDQSLSVREPAENFSPISVDYYVHECSEFPSLGEQHHGLTLDQAVEIYKSIPSGRMNGGKSIGVEIHDPTDRFYDGYTIDLYRGRILEDALEYSDHLKSQPVVQQAYQAIKDRFAPQENKAIKTTTIVPPASGPSDDNRAVYEAEFGWVRLERYKDDDIHYMTYGKDCWGQEARFVKADDSLPQVARQITQQLYGYSGPLQPVDLDAFKVMLRKAHPERYIDAENKEHTRRRHPHH